MWLNEKTLLLGKFPRSQEFRESLATNYASNTGEVSISARDKIFGKTGVTGHNCASKRQNTTFHSDCTRGFSKKSPFTFALFPPCHLARARKKSLPFCRVTRGEAGNLRDSCGRISQHTWKAREEEKGKISRERGRLYLIDRGISRGCIFRHNGNRRPSAWSEKTFFFFFFPKVSGITKTNKQWALCADAGWKA